MAKVSYQKLKCIIFGRKFAYTSQPYRIQLLYVLRPTPFSILYCKTIDLSLNTTDLSTTGTLTLTCACERVILHNDWQRRRNARCVTHSHSPHNHEEVDVGSTARSMSIEALWLQWLSFEVSQHFEIIVHYGIFFHYWLYIVQRSKLSYVC